MRVTNEQAAALIKCDNMPNDCRGCKNLIPTGTCNSGRAEDYAADLLEARHRIKDLSEAMLEISQRPISSVCEEVRQKARTEWERSKEYL